VTESIDLTKKPVDLVGLVDYAEGSVVSRTLQKRKTGTITLFAFDRDQSLSEHTAPFDATVLVLDGKAELTIGGRKIEVGAGQLVVMPADIPHAVRAPEPFKMLLVMIRE
jgi:quercetin dioxygenase-like cupin family protein